MLFGGNRRVARRTARRTSRRQMAMYGDDGGYDDAPAPAAEPQGPSDAEQLQEFAKLHEQGVLTDEEFEAKKKQILGI